MRKIILIFVIISKFVCIVIPLLVAVAYFTIAERKIMGSIQRRKGPNIVGYIGFTQPFADGLKLFVKETTLPTSANTGIFLFAPALAFVLSLLGWVVIPFSEGILFCDLNLGALYLLAISSLNVYGILLAGWSSNSKYAYLGALRSAAQMISYEIAMGFSVLSVAICAGSYNLTDVVLAQKDIWYAVPLLPVFAVFCVSMLAETNRHPFDLPEAEAELVSGYNVEYSAMAFAFFFLSEYANMLLMSAFASIFFLGGWLPPLDNFFFNMIPGSLWLSFKIILGVVFFIITRATLPRYRYDQLMSLGWKCFLPLSMGYFILTSGILISFNWLPN
jgi:NADH-quinone oxidoreductase subunit H